jgi:hypothetical protein
MSVPIPVLQCFNNFHCGLFFRDILLLPYGFFFLLDLLPSLLVRHPIWPSSLSG